MGVHAANAGPRMFVGATGLPDPRERDCPFVIELGIRGM